MPADAAVRQGTPLWVSPLHSDFVLMTPTRSLRASGTLARVTLPAAGAARDGSLFQRALEDGFARARRAGVARPIAIGAIPFDQTQPSCLSIPQCHEWFGRAEVLDGLTRAEPPPHDPVGEPRLIPDRATFERSVAQATAAFDRGEADKVVLSRLCDLTFDRAIEPDWLLHRLIEQNPHGYHFRVPLPDGGTLVGASPELLLSKYGAAIRSHPLAGTARRAADPAADAETARALRRSAKDRREHGYVTTYLREKLEPLCDRLDIPDMPEVVATPTAWHLGTPIAGTLRSRALSALQLACALHPTPALGGYPGDAAADLIRAIEPFERGLFGGIVGWCDADGDGEWVVAIRCGEVRDRQVRLFAGAGIVAGSDPANEWQETATKLSTMFRALGIGAIGQ